MATLDVKEVVKQAAQQEDKAYKFYMDALKFVKDAAAQLWLKELAGEELKHKELLQNFDTSKIKKFKPEKIQDLHITEYLVDKDISDVKDFQDVLVVAMKKEQKSYNFYVSMAKSTDNPEMKNLCKILAQEELKHKHKLELYYDDNVYQWD
ncbi:MAG: ferritin family protein [Planctomycetia bacterium]|nr:ferritin family protein [Planctomycetia bacterium]